MEAAWMPAVQINVGRTAAQSFLSISNPRSHHGIIAEDREYTLRWMKYSDDDTRLWYEFSLIPKDILRYFKID